MLINSSEEIRYFLHLIFTLGIVSHDLALRFSYYRIGTRNAGYGNGAKEGAKKPRVKSGHHKRCLQLAEKKSMNSFTVYHTCTRLGKMFLLFKLKSQPK